MTALRSTTIRIKSLYSTAIFTCAMLTAASALAAPPLATDDAGTVEVGKAEIELNGSYIHDKEQAHGITAKRSVSETEIKLTTGLFKNTGISLALPYTISERIKEDGQLVGSADGFGDMTLELKYTFAELSGVNLAIKPTLIIPTGKYSAGLSEGRWQAGGTLIASREFADGAYALHANLGYEYHSYRTEDLRQTSRSNIWSGSIAGEAEVAKGLFAVADFGLATSADKTTRQVSAYALTGVRYALNDQLDVNAGVKFGITRTEDDVTAVYGVTLKY